MAREKPVNTNERFADELSAMEEKLALLQNTYEKYFLGIERRPPDKDRKLVSETIRRMKNNAPKSVMMRFRMQTLFAKLLSYERMWDRTLREIEEGRYHRHLFKVKMHAQKQQETDAQKLLRPVEPDQQGQQGLPELPDIAPASSPPPAARASQPPPSGISDASMKRLYETYLKAREQTGESNAGLTYDAIASKIKGQIPSLLAKHNARAVDFKVVIKNGKAVLKAVPKA